MAAPSTLLVYVPGVVETSTPKWMLALPPAGAVMGPQVRLWPEIEGSAVVAPDVVPARYVKPAGRVSTTEPTVTAALFGLDTVMVYPS